MTIRALVLDDSDERHTRFAASLSGVCELTHARLFSEFTAALRQRFDVVYLDHDLGDEIDQEKIPGMYGGDRVVDGTDAAALLCDLPAALRPSRVVVHSWNWSGAQRMMKALRDADYAVHVEQYGAAMLGSERLWMIARARESA